ncbi:Glycosyl transferase group 1 [Patulibacter medicamentivorans]|uniref:Glycosyl transferase group 1 n=1 Tax=Patulibacter medicamentivorans TaxID=1097667 RepID=H0E8Z6_9ACTN|nr:glycosyltransferase family 4 protein [Patulibacter medicamentivorans]EHN09849.1 Glycosyl transferase group 1 [Patulibacter medicamentivorans]
MTATAGPRPVLYLHSSAGRYGADRQLTAMVRGLDHGSFRALVVLAEDGPLVADLRDVGAEVIVRPLAVLRRELMSPAGLARVTASFAADAGGLGRLARLRDVALVHTNTSVTLGGAATARIARIPHVWHVREIYTGFDRWWPAYRRLLLSADALPCVSEAVREQFDGAQRAERAQVVPDGLALDIEPVARTEARAALDLPQDAFVVAMLGRISAWKGQEVLVDALAEPPLADDPGALAVLAGSAWRDDPRLMRELWARARAHGVSERVRLPGFVDRVGLLYGAADVVVVPSTRPDPLPNAALEAAAAGCCVVAADHGGLREILDGGRTGVLVPPGDAGALARTLVELRDDPQRRARLGALAREDARSRFGSAALSERLQELYAELVA